MSTQAQLAANRANAQLSTGATSAEGKATSSLNALKTALTGRTVLLPSDDAAAYERHLSGYARELAPVGQRESDLVQAIADAAWRLDRIPGLELAYYAKGRIEFANLFENESPELRPGLIELHTYSTYERQLRNLHLQESRLHRRREKDLQELHRIQSERRTRENEALETAARAYAEARLSDQAFDPAAHGFEFSIAQIESFIVTGRASRRVCEALRDFEIPSVAARCAA